MDLGEEHYCVRWKGYFTDFCLTKFHFGELSGFQSNIVSALEDLKNDESFVDVTLSCDGETIQVLMLKANDTRKANIYLLGLLT